MKSSLDNLSNSLHDILSLIELSISADDEMQKNVVYRSAIVLLIASWEQYIEQLAEKAVLTLTDRLRNSIPIPEKVKQCVSSLIIIEDKSKNIKKFSDAIWKFSDKGWKKEYIKYCKDTTSKLNTASSINVIEIYKKILGIKDITNNWNFKNQNPSQCSEMLDDLMDLRHDIAHGANHRASELSKELITEKVKFILEIANNTFEVVFNEITKISISQAIHYSLSQHCFSKIISLAAQKDHDIIFLKEIKSLGSSAQGNHNKLCYEPWGLLKNQTKNSRRVTERLRQFYNGEITLPFEILVFDNGEAISMPDTKHVYFSDLS